MMLFWHVVICTFGGSFQRPCCNFHRQVTYVSLHTTVFLRKLKSHCSPSVPRNPKIQPGRPAQWMTTADATAIPRKNRRKEQLTNVDKSSVGWLCLLSKVCSASGSTHVCGCYHHVISIDLRRDFVALDGPCVSFGSSQPYYVWLWLGYAWVALLIATLWMMLVGSCLLTIAVIEF